MFLKNCCFRQNNPIVCYNCANSCWGVLWKQVVSQNKLFCKIIKVIIASSTNKIPNPSDIVIRLVIETYSVFKMKWKVFFRKRWWLIQCKQEKLVFLDLILMVGFPNNWKENLVATIYNITWHLHLTASGLPDPFKFLFRTDILFRKTWYTGIWNRLSGN